MNPRKILRIARWEVLKGTDSLDRRTVVIAIVALAITAGLGSAISAATITPDAGLYVVGVDEDDPYYDAVEQDPTFIVRKPDRAALGDEIDVLITGTRVVAAETPKGQAALSELQVTVTRYNDARMRAEPNQSAAFPVEVELEYVSRAAPLTTGNTGDGGGGGGGGFGGGDGSDDGSDDESDGGGLSVPRFGGQPLFSTTQAGTPGSISPPFPFGALLLAFIFIVPMNFVIQAYGASILRERLKRRGELMLVSPVSAGDIVAGKTLPYLVGSLGIATGIALWVGGGIQSLLAVLPIALVFLAATFAAAMFARSFKELTFLTVTISVGLTSYAFVPAIFSEVHPIAFISPLTIVVKDLLGQSIGVGDYLFSTLPFYLSAVVLFVLGVGIYREEDMFTQRPVHLKLLDAFASRISRARRRGLFDVMVLTAAFLPFVLVAELLVIALLFALPLVLTLPLLFGAIALVEELAKSLHIYAGFAHDRFERTPSVALALGAASGFGFFLGEKVVVVAQTLFLSSGQRLQDIPSGQAAFPSAGGLDPVMALVLLVAPLALHVGTASMTAYGASKDSHLYGTFYLVAVMVHVAYNVGVVALAT